MKTVTIEQFMSFEPCYSEERVCELAGGKTEWTALDVLRLEQVPVVNRFWAVLREEFIDAPILHEFACRCAEKALTLVDNPDQRSIDAIAAKRAWMRGEITDEQLDAAGSAAWSAAWSAARSAADAARYAARSEQVDMLIEMLEDVK